MKPIPPGARVFTASVTFVMVPECGGFPTIVGVRKGIAAWAADWSYADRGSAWVIEAQAQRRPDLEKHKP
jgi:hypothetical protein